MADQARPKIQSNAHEVGTRQDHPAQRHIAFQRGPGESISFAQTIDIPVAEGLHLQAMSRTTLVNLSATAAGSLLLLTTGCASPDTGGNQLGRESPPSQERVSGCSTSDRKDEFVLDPGTKSGVSAPLYDNAKLPPTIQVDANRHKILATRIGVGVQVYDHDSANGKWTVREPQANLYDSETGLQQGIHFAGPFWTDTDGSRVKAKASGEADSPTDGQTNVKWLKLEAVESFGGDKDVLRQVTFIQRILTKGGQPPSTQELAEGCDTVSVPYTALYVFWGPKERN